MPALLYGMLRKTKNQPKTPCSVISRKECMCQPPPASCCRSQFHSDPDLPTSPDSCYMSIITPKTIPATAPIKCLPCLPAAAFCRLGVALVVVAAPVSCVSAGTYVVAVTMTTPPSGLVLVNVDVTGLRAAGVVKDGRPVGLSVIIVVPAR